MIENIEEFINNIQRDEENHVLLNMIDHSIMHTSFLESALRCSAPLYEKKPGFRVSGGSQLRGYPS